MAPQQAAFVIRMALLVYYPAASGACVTFVEHKIDTHRSVMSRSTVTLRVV